jgi:3-oxoacyl-[acyl-carrier protein] reductase
MDLGLDGRVALISGGSRGIGRAIAMQLAQEGCDVTMVSRTEADLKEAAVAITGETGRRVEICATDLRSPQGCEAAVGAHTEAFGRLDILINNAGATAAGTFLEVDDADWEDGFALKFYSYLRLARDLWPMLVAADDGAVINIIGLFSKTPNELFAVGGAVNTAVTSLSQSMANQGLLDGVAVNAVHPGLTLTDRFEMILTARAEREGMSREDLVAADKEGLGIRGYSKPEDIAALVAFLVSPVGRQVHGADVFIDGGQTKSIL